MLIKERQATAPQQFAIDFLGLWQGDMTRRWRLCAVLADLYRD
jgi:hypothetical protein